MALAVGVAVGGTGVDVGVAVDVGVGETGVAVGVAVGGTEVGVRVAVDVGVGEACVTVGVAVGGTGVGVFVDVGGGVLVGVAVGPVVLVAVGVGALPVLGSRHHCTSVPVSAAAASVIVRVHVPFKAWPSKALNRLLGLRLPESAGGVELQVFSARAEASSSKMALMLSELHPKLEAGTPGRSMIVTLVPPLDKVKIRSPTQVCVALMLTLRSRRLPRSVMDMLSLVLPLSTRGRLTERQ